MALVDQMIRASRLDVNLYEEVEKDTTQTNNALTVVVIFYLALNAVVNAGHLLSRLLLGFVVFHEQTGDGRSERCLPCLKRHPNLIARLRVLALTCESQHLIGRRPELCKRVREVLLLIGRPGHRRDVLLAPQTIVQIGPQPLKLRSPGGQWIRLFTVQHVAHRQPQRVEIVLDSEKLKRVFPIPIGKARLELSQSGDLPRDVPGIGDHRREGDDEAEQQPDCRRSPPRCLCGHSREDTTTIWRGLRCRSGPRPTRDDGISC